MYSRILICDAKPHDSKGWIHNRLIPKDGVLCNLAETDSIIMLNKDVDLPEHIFYYTVKPYDKENYVATITKQEEKEFKEFEINNLRQYANDIEKGLSSMSKWYLRDLVSDTSTRFWMLCMETLFNGYDFFDFLTPDANGDIHFYIDRTHYYHT